MTTRISTGNPVAANPGGWPGVQQPGGASGAPGEAQLRGVPAAAAGAGGASPTDLITPPAGASVEAAYYFLQSAQPTSPQVLPLLNIAPPGAEPPLGFTLPATAGGADPRGIPGRSAVPGQHLGSTAPATPGIELGAQPLVPAVPPASAFGVPNEASLRAIPAVAAGGVKAAPLPAAATPAGDGSLPYFLTPGGVTPAVPAGSWYVLDERTPFTAAPQIPAAEVADFRPEVRAGTPA